MAVRIYRDHFTILLERLRTMFPLSLPIHSTIRTILQFEKDNSEIWVDTWPNVRAVMVCPSGGKFGAPMLQHQRKLFATNVESALAVLQTAQPLRGQNRIDFLGVRELLWPTIETFAKSVNFSTSIPTAFVNGLYGYYLPKETPLPSSHPKVPDGCKAGCLQPYQAFTVSNLWDIDVGCDTENYMKRLIEHFPSVALYEQVTGNLVGWGLCYGAGHMGHAYVDPAFRRKGLAQYLFTSLLINLRERQEIPFGEVICGNIPMMTLHSQRGLVALPERMQWIKCIKMPASGV